DRAERIGEGTVELDLAGCERAGAELVLQAAEAKAVDVPARQHPRHEEAADPGRSCGSPAGPCGDGELIRIGDGAEPLLTGDPPDVVPGGNRVDAVRAHVGAALDLRQELCAALAAVVVRVEQRREETRTQLIRPVPPERADQPGGADNPPGGTG